MPLKFRLSIRRIMALVALCITFLPDVAAQSSGNSNILLYSIIIVAAILLIAVTVEVADSMVRVEARQHNIHTESPGFVTALGRMFQPPLPPYLQDEDVYVLKKGHDIHLEGEAQPVFRDVRVTRHAVQPPNFGGLSPIPKVIVEPGENVKAGQPIFFDKKRPDIMFVAPVSGEILEVNRGAKRAITEVVILADKEIRHVEHTPPGDSAAREDLVQFMLESGGWTLLRQRPYNLIPDPSVVPRDIFISTFDSAPLAPDNGFIISGQGETFQAGLDVLVRLTGGKVHLGLDGRGDEPPSAIFAQAEGVEKHYFRGPHPSGNVGVQIHHIKPLKPGDKVWVLGVQEVLTLGALFTTGKFDARRVIAVTGHPISEPAYVRTYAGAHFGDLLKDNITGENLRYISGDVLSGKQKSTEGYVDAFDDQVSVVDEGNEYEMFGWLLPLKERPSVSRTFPNFLFPSSTFIANTNTHGEPRAFVMTGQYEQMLPMDIYPQLLMKAIIIEDFETMEGLGIFEISEEDIALCEFACTSKMPLQQILREGHELMIEQG